ncbi:RagB/SusD family nutrient uptake outer membrane protein [uncultured Croceitalea sp.]|uniref:RagB/SusD family nutrient uptake outer membrane protein n=1 Tax=uncultured Croceitalea sp. TaxID=1798908 RepID=UPI003305E29D
MKTILRILSALIGLIFFVGCDQSDDTENVSVGNLLVRVITSEGAGESDAKVTTTPVTRSLTTDATGVAIFQDIEVGTYKVQIELSPNSNNALQDQVIEIDGVEVQEGGTKQVEYILLEGPKPIEELPLDIDLLLNDSYRRLATAFLFDIGGYSLYWGDIGADLAFVNNSSFGPLQDLDRYNVQPSNQYVVESWAAHYQLIRNSNLGLEAIANSDYVSESGKTETELQAELRFFRALVYFNLVKLYGNPVLVTNTEIDNPLLQNREGTLIIIEEDLEFAQANLSNTQSNTKASANAASALLGKFYLYLAGFPTFDSEKYVMALQQFEGLLDVYSLETDYASVFNVDNEQSNSEVIFTIDFDGSEEGKGGNTGVFWGPLGYALEDNLLLDPEFVKLYFNNPGDYQSPVIFPLNIDDQRFQNNIASFSVEASNEVEETDPTNWRPLKYISDLSIMPSRSSSSEDFPFLRYADVLLMMAEAENAVNGPTTRAYDLVNQIIQRSGSSHQLPMGLSQNDFLLEILRQRKLELCFEGSWKDDLIRNSLLESVISDFNAQNPGFSKQFESHEYIWPIPQSEINSNPNVVQNPGY